MMRSLEMLYCMSANTIAATPKCRANQAHPDVFSILALIAFDIQRQNTFLTLLSLKVLDFGFL